MLPSVKNYSVLLHWSDLDHEYVAKCVEVPGCTAGDKDFSEALRKLYENLNETIRISEEMKLCFPKPKENAKITISNASTNIIDLEEIKRERSREKLINQLRRSGLL